MLHNVHYRGVNGCAQSGDKSGYLVSANDGTGEGGSGEVRLDGCLPQHFGLTASDHICCRVSGSEGNSKENAITGQSSLHIRRKVLVFEQIVRKLALDALADLVAVLSMAIHHAEQQRAGLGVLGHDQRVLVLLLGVVRRIALLGIATIRIDNKPTCCGRHVLLWGDGVR